MRPCQAKELPVSVFFFFFQCSSMKFRPGQAEKNKKASSLYRLRQSTIAEKMKRCVPLRRNVAEKPRGMRLKFVLSQFRTRTHESKNMFVFFTSLRFYGQQESVESNPVNNEGRYTRGVLLPEHAPGSFCTCQYTRGSVLPRKLAPKYLTS